MGKEYSKSKIPNETKKIPPKSMKTAKRYQTKKLKGVKKEQQQNLKEDEAQLTDTAKNTIRRPYTVSKNREEEFREGEEQLDSAHPHTRANSPGPVWFEHGR